MRSPVQQMNSHLNKWLLAGTWERSSIPFRPLANKKPGCEAGFTLLEMIITLTIIAILAAGTVPVIYNVIKREKEMDLRRNLREIRQAIDAYKTVCDALPPGHPEKEAEDCYPPDLDALVKGIKPPNKVDEPIRFLRRIPLDPFTQNTSWGVRSMQDDPYSTSGSASSSNGIFDVYTTTQGKALDGSDYSRW